MAKINIKEKKLTRDSVLRFFGLRTLSVETKDPKAEDLPLVISDFSDAELITMSGPRTIKRNRKESNRSTLPDPTDYMYAVSNNIATIIKNNEQLYKINPELVQARDIIVQSILSPNDIQTGEVTVTSEVSGLSTETQLTVNKYLNELFNNELEFGIKLHKWLNEILFVTGAKPIIVMPRANLTNLVDKHYSEQTYSMESISVTCDSISDELLLSDTIDYYHSLDMAKDKLSEDASFKITLENVATEAISNSKKIIKNNMNNLTISYDATALYKANNKIIENKDKINDKWKSFFSTVGDTNMMYFSDKESEGNEQPSILEFPASAVIPVTVPGSKSEHIGYFVLTDEYNYPVTDAEILNNNSTSGVVRLTRETYETKVGNNKYLNKLRDNHMKVAVSSAFSMTVKHMLDKSLDNQGLHGLTVSKYNAISNCMLSKLLTNQKINMIFVPEAIMTYYCFEHREDGTGKSMIEDLAYLLSLKGTLLVAEVMSALRDAIDTKVVEVELDPKDTNIEQTLNTLTEIYIRKHMPRFTNDPDVITRDIVANSLTIVPKNIPGLENSLAISTERRTAGSARPDSDLMEKIDERAKLGLGLTPSAINQLKESEYATSVVTNNLYFGNKIRGMQRVVKKLNDKFAKNYVRYSKPVISKLESILKLSEDKTKKEEGNNKIIQQIINNLSITLPPCNVSTSKALYEELDKQMSAIENVMDKLYSDDLIAGEDRDLKDTMVAIRGHIKAKVIREAIDTLGLSGTISAPTIEEFDIKAVADMHLFTKNIKQLSDNINEAIPPPEAS